MEKIKIIVKNTILVIISIFIITAIYKVIDANYKTGIEQELYEFTLSTKLVTKAYYKGNLVFYDSEPIEDATVDYKCSAYEHGEYMIDKAKTVDNFKCKDNGKK